MSTTALVNSAEFRNAPEREQIEQMRAVSPKWKTLHDAEPEKAIAYMRSVSGYEEPTRGPSATGGVIRNFASGAIEGAADIVASPFNLAEYLGLENQGDDFIEGLIEKADFDPATTRGEEIARAGGYGAALGAGTYLTGGLLAATKLPFIAKGAQFIRGVGLGTETVAGSVGEATIEATKDVIDNEFLRVGAGIAASIAAGGAIIPMHRAYVGAVADRAKKALVDKNAYTKLIREKYPEELIEKENWKRLAEEMKEQLPKVEGTVLPDNPNFTPGANEAVDRYARIVKAIEGEDLQVLGEEGFLDPRMLTEADRVAWRRERGFIEAVHHNPELNKKLQVATADAMARAGIQYTEELPLYTQMGVAIHSEVLDRPSVDAILGEHGLSMDDISEVTFGVVLDPLRSSAQMMNQAMQVKKGLKKEAFQKKALGMDLTPEEEMLTTIGTNAAGYSDWQRATQVWKGAIVSQLASATRDALQTTVNLGVNAAADASEFAIHSLFPRWAKTNVRSYSDAVDVYGRMASSFGPGKSKEFKKFNEVQTFLEMQGKHMMDPLKAQYHGDMFISPGEGLIGGAERMVMFLNTARRTQDFWVRRAVFNSTLDRRLATRGLGGLDDVVDGGLLHKIRNDDFREAVEQAQKLTWSKDFNRHAQGMEGLVGQAMNIIQNTGIGPFQASLIMPFPRFMANSMQWMWEHSPFKMLQQALGPKSRQALIDGDVRPLIESTMGTGMLLAAWQIQQEFGTGQWDKLRIPDAFADANGMKRGTTFSAKPYNPFSSFLFGADVVKRISEDRLNDLQFKDVVNGLASTNFRAGAGMYVLDQAIDAFAGEMQGFGEGGEGLGEIAVGQAIDFAGAGWSGVLTPMRQVADIVAHFDESQRVIRDTRSERGSGVWKSMVPYAADDIPELELPTQGGPLTRPYPLTRQFTGVTLQDPKNPGSMELDRLGFKSKEILGASSKKPFTKLIAKHMGPLVENYMSQVVQDPKYQAADNATKGAIVERKLKQFRKEARARAARERPDLYRASKEGRVSKRQRRARKSLSDRRQKLEELRMAQQ